MSARALLQLEDKGESAEVVEGWRDFETTKGDLAVLQNEVGEACRASSVNRNAHGNALGRTARRAHRQSRDFHPNLERLLRRPQIQ